MNKANIFLTAGWIGLAACVVTGIATLDGVPDGIGNAGALATIAASWVMLFTRDADEYTRGLWTSAASFAFAALLLLFLGLPFAEGFYDGVREAIEDREGDYHQQDLPAEVSIGCAIAAFYIGLFWKRIRGDV